LIRLNLSAFEITETEDRLIAAAAMATASDGAYPTESQVMKATTATSTTAGTKTGAT
jgi:hypothetical protein